MKIIESFDTTPSTNVLDVLSFSGYSLQSAIADIIDNSITAQAENVWINMTFDNDNSTVAIIDDGYGMDLEKLKQASKIAFRDMNDERSETDLGRFSTGLNSASMSMCNTLIVQSKTINNTIPNTVLIDFSSMKVNGWKCFVIDTDENYIKTRSGTAVIWKNLKDIANAKTKDAFYDKIATVETHLSHVFCDYINKGLKIHINNENTIVKGWDPFFTNNTKTSCKYNDSKSYLERKIEIKIYILPPYNNLNDNEKAYMKGYGLSEQQGFYIYRNKRLIKEGGWLNIEDLSISNKYDYARIRIDIDNKLDKYFTPNFLKSEITVPDDIKDYLKRIAIKARKESHNSFNYMRAPSIIRTIKHEKQIPVWNCKNTSDGILININEKHPIIESLTSNLSKSDRNRLFKLLSKNIPIGEIYRSGLSKKQNNYVDITKELNDMYERLKEDGLSNKEIMKKMSTCEPFCLSDDYISTLIDFFENKGAI